MAKTYMPMNDAPSAKLATAFVTINNKRYSMLMAKDFEANASIETTEVPVLGRTIKGVKPTGMTIQWKMTVYKCTEIFDSVVETYKNTGVMPSMEIQVTSEDPATGIGKSTKVYSGCVIDGDVLLSMFDADGEFVEQEINGYAQDFKRPVKYTNPAYMM